MSLHERSSRFNASGSHVPLADDNERLREENLRLHRVIRAMHESMAPDMAFPRAWRLTTQQAKILAVLFAAAPKPVPLKRFQALVDGRSGAMLTAEAIRTHITHLRAKLPGIGIANTRADGWSINARARETIVYFIANPDKATPAKDERRVQFREAAE